MKSGDFVVVTTEWRGVFGGELVEHNRAERHVTLKGARMCIYWHSGGVLGLAQDGPEKRDRISKEAPEVELHGVTKVSVCTEGAAAAWREAKPYVR